MSVLRFGCRSLLALVAVIFSLSATSSAEAGRGHSGRGGGHAVSYGGSHGGGMRVAYAQPSRIASVGVVRASSGGGYGGGGYIHFGHSRHAGGHALRSVAYYAAPVRYVQPVVYRQTAYVTHTSGCRRSPRCVCD
jgi:hypothetical protein